MDEYESEDELGDMSCTPRRHMHTKPPPPKTSPGSKAKAMSQHTAFKAESSKSHSSKPKPPVPSKPTASANIKSRSSVASAKPDNATKADDDVGRFLGMKEYMDAMDRELAKTTIGKSFVRDGDEVWSLYLFPLSDIYSFYQLTKILAFH